MHLYLLGSALGPDVYKRQLWNSSRFTFEDPATRYLFESAELDLMPFDMETIPIPVDIHVARATLTLGVVKGRYEGSVQYLFESIREAWFKSVEGIIRPDGLPMIALDVDEPLWHLSRNGCSKRDRSGACAKRQTCLCKDYCIPVSYTHLDVYKRQSWSWAA